jgi:hypothetical protein
MANGTLDSIKRLNSNWCVILPLRCTNFEGLARLTRWFFSVIHEVEESPLYVEPNRPYTTWNVNELREWIRFHGLNDKGGKSCCSH